MPRILKYCRNCPFKAPLGSNQCPASVGNISPRQMLAKTGFEKPGHSERRTRSVPSLLPSEEFQSKKDPRQSNRQAQWCPIFPPHVWWIFHQKGGSDLQQTVPMVRISENMQLWHRNSNVYILVFEISLQRNFHTLWCESTKRNSGGEILNPGGRMRWPSTQA